MGGGGIASPTLFALNKRKSADVCEFCNSENWSPPLDDAADEDRAGLRLAAWLVLVLLSALVGLILLAASAFADDFDDAAIIAYENTRLFQVNSLTTDGVADCTDAANAAFLHLSDRGHRPDIGYCSVSGIGHVFLLLEDGRAIDVNNRTPVPLADIGCDAKPTVTPWHPAVVRVVRKAGVE